MAKHNILGRDGEELAARYLERKGYVILDRDWHSGHKDIDLVATIDNILVFVEVKTRTGTEWGDPKDAVTDRKILRIVKSADAYIRLNQIDKDVRFDIVSIVVEDGEFKVEHIEQAFFPPIE